MSPTLMTLALGAWSCAPAPWSHGFPSGKFPDPLFTPLASHACDASRATHQNLWTPEVLYGYRIGPLTPPGSNTSFELYNTLDALPGTA